MLSRPRKPPSKMLLPSASLRFTHHVKLMRSFWNAPSRKTRSRPAVHLRFDLVDADGGPRVHGRVHIAEQPLVGGNLPVRVHVPLAHQQEQLVLGEIRVDHRQGDHMERRVPRREPRVFPFVRHRQNVARGEVRPVMIAAVTTRLAAGPEAGPLDPAMHRIVVMLLRATASPRTPAAAHCACPRAARTASRAR